MISRPRKMIRSWHPSLPQSASAVSDEPARRRVARNIKGRGGTGDLDWNPDAAGQYSFDVTATDPAGLSDTESVTLNVAAAGNRPPRIEPILSDIYTPGLTVRLPGKASPGSGLALGFRPG